MLNTELKKLVHEECIRYIDSKLETIKNEFRLYQDSAANETKSTAGDKHDTGKAMMQMEQEKLGSQLKELLNSKNILLAIQNNRHSEKACSGSLVITDKGIFYLAASLGKISINQQEVFVISMQSPLSKFMLNKTKNEAFSFNNQTYRIIEVC